VRSPRSRAHDAHYAPHPDRPQDPVPPCTGKAQLIVTRRCNLSCGYCTEYDQTSAFIPLELLEQRIDALHRLRVVNIALLGGEPLTHPQLPEVVGLRPAARPGLRHHQRISAHPGPDRALQRRGLANMEVSIDALTPTAAATSRSP